MKRYGFHSCSSRNDTPCHARIRARSRRQSDRPRRRKYPEALAARKTACLAARFIRIAARKPFSSYPEYRRDLAVRRDNEVIAGSVEVNSGKAGPAKRDSHPAASLKGLTTIVAEIERAAGEVQSDAVEDHIGSINFAFQITAYELRDGNRDRVERQPNAASRSQNASHFGQSR